MRMRALAATLTILLAVALMAPAAATGPTDYRAPLSHAQEKTHEVNAPGAGGMATLWLEGSTLHYEIDVRHLTGPAIMAHIHAPADRGAGAGIAEWLCGTAALPGPPGTPSCSGATNGELITGSLDASASLLGDIDAGRAYVNVHTAMHQPGEVRGQILDVRGRR